MRRPEADVEEDEGEGHEEDEAVVDRGDLDLDKKMNCMRQKL